MKIKEEIYRLMDSFLVEGDQPRSIERLNQDRHLFVDNMLAVCVKEKMELVERIEGMKVISDPGGGRGMKKHCMCHCHSGSKFFRTKYTLKPKHYKSIYCQACLRNENCEHCFPHPKKEKEG